MIEMQGSLKVLQAATRPLSDVYRVTHARPSSHRESDAALLDPDATELPIDARLWLVPADTPRATAVNIAEAAVKVAAAVVQLPLQLFHLEHGDVIAVDPQLRAIRVLWKGRARHNSLLLTEQCDNYCLMCSQPPRIRDDRWLFARAMRAIPLIPEDVSAIGLTGGEPTLAQTELLQLLALIGRERPQAEIHLLSNGRRFADRQFVSAYAGVAPKGLMVGIPIYAPEPTVHDWIVQAEGAFTETLSGVLNLAERGLRTEIRVVMQRGNVDVLVELCRWITRNLPFVDQVALMGLEMTGLAIPNRAAVWVDPVDYREQLREGALLLETAHIRTKIYNHPHCLLDKDIRHLAVQSISEWKNSYLECCSLCSARNICGGLFATSGPRISGHIEPITA